MSDTKADGIEIQSAAPVEAANNAENLPHSHGHDHGHDHHDELDVVPLEEEAVRNAVHINLSWRSWLVVFMTCFAWVPSPNK